MVYLTMPQGLIDTPPVLSFVAWGFVWQPFVVLVTPSRCVACVSIIIVILSFCFNPLLNSSFVDRVNRDIEALRAV